MNGSAFADQSLPTFPDSDDWAGWIDVWCRDDTGNIDCVPECLRHHVLHLVTPEGWMKYPDMVPNTPYKIARWFQFGGGRKIPPWAGTGLTPYQAKRVWLDKIAEEEAAQQAEADALADLYFIQSGSDGPIKIGITGGPIEKRMKGLQTAHPFKLVLLALVRGAGMQEPEYHSRFAEHRLEGEWFAPHPDILDEIERLSLPHPTASKGRVS